MQKINGPKVRILLLLQFFFALIAIQNTEAQILYNHNFGTSTISTHPYTAAPATIDSNLSGSSWTNSVGTWTSNAGATGQAIMVNTPAGTTTITLNLNIVANYEVSITSFSFWRQRSNSGPRDWSMTINGIQAGSGNLAAATGAGTGTIPVSNPVTVQNNITVVLTLENATGGNFRLDDFILNGSALSTCTGTNVTSFLPVNGPAGTIVTINGSGFTGATGVKFGNATSPSFTVESDNIIKAVMPANGNGRVTVVNSTGCTGVSATNYTLLTSNCITASGQDIYISELYDQKSGSGGMIELYNPTGSTITFNGQYVLQRYGDIDATTPTAGYILTLPGSIGPGMTYLISGSAPNQGICSTPSAVTSIGNGFNGNDKFELLKGPNVIDRVLVPFTAAGFTLIRRPNATAPSATYIPGDWNNTQHGSGNNSSYCANLGQHTVAVQNPPNITQPVTKTICENANVSFTTTLSTPAGYTYRWKRLNASGVWENITNDAMFSGATTNTLTITGATASMDGSQYYCEMVSSSCTVRSNAVQLYITEPMGTPVLTPTHPTCTNTNGTITIDSPTGTGFTYSMDGSAYQNSNVFTAGPGSHTITVKNAGGCTVTATITINTVPGAPVITSITPTHPKCTNPNGSITVIATGTGLEYSIDGTNFQTSNILTAGPGNHTVTVRNAAGCTVIGTTTINPAPQIPTITSITPAHPTCTNPNGSITVVATGTALEYSLDGTNFQTSNILTAGPGNYTITVRNADGCIVTGTTTVNPALNAPVITSITPTHPTCTDTNGTITVIATGTGLEYSIDGTTFQTNNDFIVSSGSHTITVRNADGCTTTGTTTVNPAPQVPVITAITPSHPTCTNPNGSITVIATGTGLEYSTDGTNFQTSNVFTVGSGNHTVTVRNADGCIIIGTTTINPVPAIPVITAITPSHPTCTNPNGSITVTATGTGLEYSLDGATFQTGNVLTAGLGSHTVTVRNAAGCTITGTTTVNPAPPIPVITSVVSDHPECNETTGTVTINATGTGLTYSLDASPFQIGNVFTIAPGTYDVEVMNADGCIAQGTVTVNPTPANPVITNITPAHPSCTNTSSSITVTATGTGLEYSLDGTNFQNSNVLTAGPGSHTVTVRNAAGCTVTGTTTINPLPVMPVITGIMPSHPTCTNANGSVTVNATGTGLEYSIDGTNFQNSNVFTIGSGSHTITVRNAAGCTVTGTTAVNPAPAVPVIVSTAIGHPNCNETTGTVTINATGTGLTYSLDASPFQTGNIFTIAPGTYDVEVMNADGCIAQGTVTVNPTPANLVITNITPAHPGCNQANGTITVNATGTGLEYSLDGVNFQNSNILTATPGSHTITVRTSAGCTVTGTTVVNPTPANPVITTITPVHPTCTSPNGSITVNATGTGLQYSLDGAPYQNSNIFTVAPGNYTITVRNATGCTVTGTIIVNPILTVPVITGIVLGHPGCGQTNGTITVNATGTNLQYSLNGGSFQNSNIFTVAPGPHTITVRNNDGCTVTGTTTINAVPPTPGTVIVTRVQSTCTNPLGRITVTAPSGSLTYSIDGTNFQSNPVFTTGEGTYTVTVRNSAGCTNTLTGVVIDAAPQVPDVPQVSRQQPDCTNAMGSISITNGIAGNMYSLNGTAWQAGTTFTVPAGSYTVRVRNTDGCTAQLTGVIINPQPALGNAGTITGNNAVCENGTIQLANAVTGGTWESSNTNIATVDANGLVHGISGGTVTILYTVNSTCPATVQKIITIHALPAIGLLDNYYLCVNNVTGAVERPVLLNTGLQNSIYTFTWTKNGSPLPLNSADYVVTEPGRYTVTATNRITGCTSNDSTTVGISSIADAYAEVGQDFDFRQTIKVHVRGGSGEYLYSLDGGPFQEEPYFTGSFEGEYTITVKDKHGCGEFTLEVFALNYPRFFTPNGDGSNETWNINGLRNQTDAKIYIFDRYGKIIQTIVPGRTGWDGTYNGYRLPATDYWFKLLYRSSSGQQKEFKAHFSLKR